MIDITGLVKANSAAPAPASKPKIKNKDTRKVWDMTLEEIGYYLSLCDSNEKAMRFMSLLSPEQIKMITEEGEKASAELVAENEKIEPDDEALFDSADDEDSEEAEYESDDADFFNSDDDEDSEEEEYEASEDEEEPSEDNEEPSEALDTDEALFEDSDEDEEEPVEPSDDAEAFFEDSDEDEEPDEDVSAPSEPSNTQETGTGTATRATEGSVAECDEMFFDNSDDNEEYLDDSDEDALFAEDSDDNSDEDELFSDDSDEDSDEDALFADNSDEDAGDEDIFSDNAEDDSDEEEVFNVVQPSIAPQPIRPQPVVTPKQNKETGTVQRNIPVKTSQIPADKIENPVRNPAGTSTRGYDVSNKKNLCGEKYQDGWSLIKYLQANRGNKKACSKEVVLHYYSLEAVERGEDMGKFVISKGILRF